MPLEERLYRQGCVEAPLVGVCFESAGGSRQAAWRRKVFVDGNLS